MNPKLASLKFSCGILFQNLISALCVSYRKLLLDASSSFIISITWQPDGVNMTSDCKIQLVSVPLA